MPLMRLIALVVVTLDEHWIAVESRTDNPDKNEGQPQNHVFLVDFLPRIVSGDKQRGATHGHGVCANFLLRLGSL